MSKTLCKLKKESRHSKTLDPQDAKYVCRKCGLCAAKKRLCKPTRIRQRSAAA